MVPARRDQREYLREHGVTIWDEWADENGELGPVYGKQWRAWPAPDGRQIDQIGAGGRAAAQQSGFAPHHRQRLERGRARQMKLMPCHAFFQFYVGDGKPVCQLYQRSADIFLGVPFNIASYALLTHMLAQQCDLEVGEFIWTGGDCHLYSTISSRPTSSSRACRSAAAAGDQAPAATIFDYRFEDFQIVNYQHHPAIKAPVAV